MGDTLLREEVFNGSGDLVPCFGEGNGRRLAGGEGGDWWGREEEIVTNTAAGIELRHSKRTNENNLDRSWPV